MIDNSRTQSLGRGVTRVHSPGIGFADLAAIHSTCGWTVEVQKTNITDEKALAVVVEQFKGSEGLHE